MSVLAIGRATQAPLAPRSEAPRRDAASCDVAVRDAAPRAGALSRRWHVSQRILGLGMLACAAGMVPWLVVLAVTLPSATHVPHWSAAWVGLDGLEAVGLAATGWLLRRGDRRRCLPAAATAALLLVDAWFDVSTAGSGGSLVEAVAMAVFAEIPMAALCAVVAWRAL
jgi:hypothetical protein